MYIGLHYNYKVLFLFLLYIKSPTSFFPGKISPEKAGQHKKRSWKEDRRAAERTGNGH